MSLTLKAEQRLRAAGAIDFFDQQRVALQDIARQALNYVRNNFPQGATVRMDDVAKALTPIIEVHPAYKGFLSRKKLTQKYWISDFADLIIDRVWTQINQP